MKFGVFALACLVASASAVYYDTGMKKTMMVDQDFIHLVLRHNWQPLVLEEYKEYMYAPVLDETKYSDVDIYKKYIYRFFDLYEHGLVLPRGRVGSFFDKKFLKQTTYLFKLFYYSVDMPTLFHNIIWARQNVNELMFIHALHLTVFHRHDLRGIYMPPLYEIMPNHFFTHDVIKKGIDYKMAGLYNLNKTFTTYADYTSRYYLDRFGEQRMAYFTEDIGLNSFYYYFNMRYPICLGHEVKDTVVGFDKEPVGELWFYLHQQLLARYYLERMSNDMGRIPTFTWIKGIKNGYWPMLHYKNGIEFSYRSDYYDIKSMDTEMLDMVNDLEYRVRDMIDSGYITLNDKRYYVHDPQFIDILGHLMVGNVHENKYYRYLLFFYHMLAGGYKTHKVDSYYYMPSVLEHFETMLRDPVFWQLYKRVMSYYMQYKNILPKYQVDDLYVPVKIQDVIVSPLKTYFEYDQVDATNVITMNMFEPKFDFKFYIRQPRLNYEPFEVKLLADVKTAGDYTVRFFLGPKVLNRYKLNDVRQYFFELDHFITKFVAGQNTIVRKSSDFLYLFRDLFKYTETGDYKYLEKYGFPAGLLLPKGKVGGMPFTFYVIVHKNDGKQRLGFPFDRKIDVLDFFVPNMYFKDVIITQYADYDVHSDTPLNNIYYKDMIPMSSIRVPLNVDYYTDNKLDYVFRHKSDVYKIWYKKYMNYEDYKGKSMFKSDKTFTKDYNTKYGYNKDMHKDMYDRSYTRNKYDDTYKTKDYYGENREVYDMPYTKSKYDVDYNTKYDHSKKLDRKMYDTEYMNKEVYDLPYTKVKYESKYTPMYKDDKYAKMETKYEGFPIIGRIFGGYDI